MAKKKLIDDNDHSARGDFALTIEGTNTIVRFRTENQFNNAIRTFDATGVKYSIARNQKFTKGKTDG